MPRRGNKVWEGEDGRNGDYEINGRSQGIQAGV